MALLGRIAQRVSDQPPSVLGSSGVVGTCDLVEPTFTRIECNSEMVFGDVTDMVCYRASHIQLGVVLERFEEGKRELRVVLKLAQSHGPRQSRTSSLAHETTDVQVAIGRPVAQEFESLLPMLDEERSEAELGGKALSEFVVCVHAAGEAGDSVSGDQAGMGQVEEGREPIPLCRDESWTERGDENRGELVEVLGELFCHPLGNVIGSLLEFELLQSVYGIGSKTTLIESGENVAERFSDEVDERCAHELLERDASLNTARG